MCYLFERTGRGTGTGTKNAFKDMPQEHPPRSHIPSLP